MINMEIKVIKAIVIEVLMDLNIIDSVPENLTQFISKRIEVVEPEIPIINE